MTLRSILASFLAGMLAAFILIAILSPGIPTDCW
jgi:hypothetical protein